ncbi:MAG TPA: glycosyltransferase, partial [Chthoniobacterales bacterium]
MSVRLGIGITTFNRSGKLGACIARLQERTTHSFDLVVADDGSTDATAETCAKARVIRIAGPNMGIAWNKNRALFFLHRVLECDVIMLIEDDCYPNQRGWETEWIEAAR